MTNVLGPGQTLAAGRRLHAPTRPVTLVMQADGDLVLLKSGAETLWSAGTAGKGATHAEMRTGGNLALVGSRKVVWQTKTNGHRGARLVVQDDGNLVVYGADRSVVWQSGTVTEWAAATGDRLRTTEALFPGWHGFGRGGQRVYLLGQSAVPAARPGHGLRADHEGDFAHGCATQGGRLHGQG